MMTSRKTVADYPELVAQWHWSKNGGLKPKDCSHGSHRKVWWQCEVELDHEWEATVKSRTIMGSGCPCCAGKKVVPSNCLPTTHPNISDEWHTTLNGDLKPEDVSYGAIRKVFWQCPVAKDHVYQATPNDRTNMGSGCPCCAGKMVVPSNCFLTTHPEIAKEWHSTLNGDLKPENFTSGSGVKIFWQCSVESDHVYQTRLCSRTQPIPTTCPCCTRHKVVPSNCLTATHPDIAKEWHPTKNGDLRPEDFLSGSHKKIFWQCPVMQDHVYEATLNKRTAPEKQGCPRCNESKGEKQILKTLQAEQVYHQRQFRFTNCKNILSLPFDFLVLPHDKDPGFIEYQGQLHFMPITYFGGEEALVKRQLLDQIKRDFCAKHNLPYLEIPYWKFKDIPKLLKDFIAALPPRRDL